MNDQHPQGYFSRHNFLKTLTLNLVKLEDLSKKNSELHSVIDTQKRIISILAHDLRNPLTSLKNIIELKQSDIIDTEDVSKMMDLVAGQLDTTIEMVDNVVNWGQLHLQVGELQPENFDLQLLVKKVFGSELLNSTAKHNALLNNVTNNSIIFADQRVLEFILRNLISNANKFTENGSIEVSMEQKENTVITVKDTGVGMSSEKAKKLFSNPNNNSTLGTKKEKGNGLGLLLVKEFIERMNGSITVESELNKGTCFKIAF